MDGTCIAAYNANNTTCVRWAGYLIGNGQHVSVPAANLVCTQRGAVAIRSLRASTARVSRRNLWTVSVSQF